MTYTTQAAAQSVADRLNSRKNSMPVEVLRCDRWGSVGYTSVHKFWIVVIA